MNTYKMGAAGWVLSITIAIILIAPLAVIGLLAFSDSQNLTFPPPSYSTRWFSELTTDSEWTTSMRTSLRLALLSCGVALLFGVPLALGLSRGAIGRLRAVQGLVAAPQIVPIVSTAIGFYFVSARLGTIGTLTPLIVAHVTFALPLIVVAVLAADRGIDPHLEPAARTLGASFGRTLLRVTLPLLAPGIVAGAVFAFLVSWDDIVNAVFLGNARVRPFPLKLWNEMQFTLSPIIASAAVLISIVSMSVVGVAALIYRIRRNRMSADVAESIVLRTTGGS